MKLKFRLFSEAAKSWHYWGFLDEYTFKSPPCIDLPQTEIEDQSEPFIGKLDKFLKEIYIGDIIGNVSGTKNLIYQICFGEFRDYRGILCLGLYTKTLNSSYGVKAGDCCILNPFIASGEIIGNIHI